MDTVIEKIIAKELNCAVRDVKIIGKGGSGCVYKALLDKEPNIIALKVSDFPNIIKDEYEQIKFISDRVDCKLPKLFFLHIEDGRAYLGMELIHGVEASKKALFLRPNKQKLVNEIVDNLIKIHSVHNEKFGPINNAVYDTWGDYYRIFAKEIYDFTLCEDTKTPDIVKKAVKAAFSNIDTILEDCNNTPTLTHGDYWLPNFLVDPKTMSLRGIIDPFKVMWSESEYELFALTVGYGEKLHLYEAYKSKVPVSKFCDLKVELYALFNELNWYKETGKIGFGYLIFRSKRLLKHLDSAEFFNNR